MKRLSHLLIMLLAVLCLPAQPQGSYTVHTYTNISSLNQQNTDSTITLPVVVKKMRYGFWSITSKDSITFYKTDITKQSANNLGKLLAYSVGDTFYIKAGDNKLHRHNRFARATKAGHYYIYTDRGVYVAQHIPFIWFTYPQIMFVDYKSGKKFSLSAFCVRKVIKDNTALANSFKADKTKRQHLRDYLEAYSDGKSSLFNANK